MVEALGGNVQVIQLEVRALEAAKKGKGCSARLGTGVEDKTVGQGRLPRLREEVQHLSEESMYRWPIVRHQPV